MSENDIKTIKHLYCNEKLTPAQIAKEYSTSDYKIRILLEKNGIKLRTLSESLKARKIPWRHKISKSLQGHKVTEETKQKISKTHKGKPSPRKGASHKTHPQFNILAGKRHWNWQGGKTDTIHKIRNSIEYKQWRRLVYERDKFTCQQCKQKGGYLNAHHIIPFKTIKENNNLLYDINNGITLCVKCHKNHHNLNGK